MFEDSLIVEWGEDGKWGIEGENTDKTYTVGGERSLLLKVQQKIGDKEKISHTHAHKHTHF